MKGRLAFGLTMQFASAHVGVLGAARGFAKTSLENRVASAVTRAKHGTPSTHPLTGREMAARAIAGRIATKP